MNSSMKTRMATDGHSVTVVIPAYNASDSIIRALNSVYSQTLAQNILEVIVIDDGSTDSTLDIVREYKRHNRRDDMTIITQKNSGPSVARNKGIKQATSKWIAFLDSDDSWESTKIERQVECLVEHPNISIIATASEHIRSTQGKKVKGDLYHFNLFSYLRVSRISTPSVVARRQSLIDAGLFNEGIRYAEDQNLFMSLIYKHDAYIINQPLTILAHKHVFGDKGLSANLKMMHQGVVSNIKTALDSGFISPFQYLVLCANEHVKYARRRLISWLR